jgi:hypothetical protein
MGKMEGMAPTANPDRPAATACTTGNRPSWFPDWRGETVAIIASGPSAKKAGVELLQGRAKVLAINESWQLAPWADALYGCDGRWWQWRGGAPKFKGLKIAYEITGDFKDIHRVFIPDRKRDTIVMEPLGHIGAGGNSGFQALNLAAQFGARRILLVGFDMRIDLGSHWHPPHYPPLSNPHDRDNLPRWRKAIDGASECFSALGIEVINCSDVSMLKSYPKMTIEEALNG